MSDEMTCRLMSKRLASLANVIVRDIYDAKQKGDEGREQCLRKELERIGGTFEELSSDVSDTGWKTCAHYFSDLAKQARLEAAGGAPPFPITEFERGRESVRSSNPCIVKSFEAVDEAGHRIRAVLGVEDGVRRFSICHTEDSKEHVCYQSLEKPEDQYDFVKRMFEAWGYKMTGEITGESCL